MPDEIPRPTGPTELRADAISVRFEGVTAVDNVSLSIRRGEIVGLIGQNGAGITTLVNALSGYQRPSGGVVFLADHDVTVMAPNRLARLGLTSTFQPVRVFLDITVYE